MEPQLPYMDNMIDISNYLSSPEIDDFNFANIALNNPMVENNPMVVNNPMVENNPIVENNPKETTIREKYELVLQTIKSDPKFKDDIYSTPDVINISTVLLSYPHLMHYIEEYIHKETNKINKSKTTNLKINKKRKSKQYVPREEQNEKYRDRRQRNTESARRTRARQREQKKINQFINLLD